VEPSEDPTKFADEVDEALEDPLAKRKGRVKTEGYDSDSSDDGEGVVLSRRKADNAEGDDDDDMFAIGEKDGQKEEDVSGKKKKEEYLRLGDIEGQEFGNKSGSDEEDTSEGDSQPEDEDDAERRKKTGMGFELSSFNMREEMEEGKFAADGTYVRSFDPHGVHDKWMEGVDEREMKLARRRKRHQERIQKEKMKAEEKELEESGGKAALEMELLAMLKKGETILEALQRLGAQKKQSVDKKPQKGKDKAELDDNNMNIDRHDKPPSHIDQITHLASNIMALGDTDVYSRTYEELVRSVRSAGRVDSSWVPPSADPKYEYKWDVPGAAGQVGEAFGPFGEMEMKNWFRAAYFGSSGEKVKVREVGGEWGEWDEVIT